MPMSLMRVNALVTERLPGDIPLTRDLLKMLEAGDNVVTDTSAVDVVRAPARPAGRAAPPRGVSATPRARGRSCIDTWIASELVATLLGRNLAARRTCNSGLLRDAERDRRVGAADAERGRDANGTPLTTVSDRLRRMVADGDVERVANPDDGRSHHVRLTAEGDARWRRGWPALQTTIEQIGDNLEQPGRRGRDAIEELIARAAEGVDGTCSDFVASSPVS